MYGLLAASPNRLPAGFAYQTPVCNRRLLSPTNMAASSDKTLRLRAAATVPSAADVPPPDRRAPAWPAPPSAPVRIPCSTKPLCPSALSVVNSSSRSTHDPPAYADPNSAPSTNPLECRAKAQTAAPSPDRRAPARPGPTRQRPHTGRPALHAHRAHPQKPIAMCNRRAYNHRHRTVPQPAATLCPARRPSPGRAIRRRHGLRDAALLVRRNHSHYTQKETDPCTRLQTQNWRPAWPCSNS